MNMNTLLIKYRITFCLILFTLTCRSQTGVYLTYEDYKNKTQIEYDNVDLVFNKLVFKTKDNREVKYAVKDIWGFKLDYQLFRCQGSSFYYVSFYGKVTMYSNGKANFYGMKHLPFTANERASYYISSGLGEEIYSKTAYKKFKEDYPQHQHLYDCTGNSSGYSKFQQCLSIYNSSK